jgi:hydroxyethylthiazole kinase-like uncharacterized protein yjeF
VKSFRLGSFGSVTLPGPEPEWGELPSASEMRAFEERAMAAGTPALELMERAGSAVVREVLGTRSISSRIVILCGPGNNGGDGLVVARLLREKGFYVSIFVSSVEKFSAQFLTQLKRVVDVSFYPRIPQCIEKSALSHGSEHDLLEALSGCDLVIDALLGIGQKNAPRGVILEMVMQLRAVSASRHDLSILALDIPTGVDSDSGAVYEPHVSANATVTFARVKRGMLQFPARSACGRIAAYDIGLSGSASAEFTMASGDSAVERLSLPLDIHKGSKGHVLVIAGSRAMAGAAHLSSFAALRAGAGLVTCVLDRSWDHGSSGTPEIMRHYCDFGEECFSPTYLDGVVGFLSSASTVAIGPGLGLGEGVRQFVVSLMETLLQRDIPTVVDASALHHIASSSFRFRHGRVVCTPHPGEAATLLGCSSTEIQSDRFAAVRKLATQYEATFLLKGAGTVIYENGTGTVVPRGTPALATAGSGDVLTGIIAAFLAAGQEPRMAAVHGCYAHAVAGERATLRRGGPIVARDLLDELPSTV